MIAALARLFLFSGGAVVLGLGGWRVISGDMTLGGLITVYMLATGFLLPVGRFVQSADAFEILQADLQRINDVLMAPEDPVLASAGSAGRGGEGVVASRGRLRLAGRIEVRGVTFGYRPGRAPLIEDLDLTSPTGPVASPPLLGRRRCGHRPLCPRLISCCQRTRCVVRRWSYTTGFHAPADQPMFRLLTR